MNDGCVEVASSIEEMQNKFDVVFGDMRNEVDKWAQEYSDAIGRNKNDIKTYLADQQNLLVGFGMTRQAGAEMAEQMTSLALDLASLPDCLLQAGLAAHHMGRQRGQGTETGRTAPQHWLFRRCVATHQRRSTKNRHLTRLMMAAGTGRNALLGVAGATRRYMIFWRF